MEKTNPPRKMADLAARLLAEGATAGSFAIGGNGAADDLHRLICLNGQYQVAYMERGLAHAPEYATEDETEACTYFYNLISAQQHWHICGVFVRQDAAKVLVGRLALLDLHIKTDSVPYTSTARYFRIFVLGRDVFAARKLLGELPIKGKGVL